MTGEGLQDVLLGGVTSTFSSYSLLEAEMKFLNRVHRRLNNSRRHFKFFKRSKQLASKLKKLVKIYYPFHIIQTLQLLVDEAKKRTKHKRAQKMLPRSLGAVDIAYILLRTVQSFLQCADIISFVPIATVLLHQFLELDHLTPNCLLLLAIESRIYVLCHHLAMMSLEFYQHLLPFYKHYLDLHNVLYKLSHSASEDSAWWFSESCRSTTLTLLQTCSLLSQRLQDNQSVHFPDNLPGALVKLTGKHDFWEFLPKNKDAACFKKTSLRENDSFDVGNVVDEDLFSSVFSGSKPQSLSPHRSKLILPRKRGKKKVDTQDSNTNKETNSTSLSGLHVHSKKHKKKLESTHLDASQVVDQSLPEQLGTGTVRSRKRKHSATTCTGKESKIPVVKLKKKLKHKEK